MIIDSQIREWKDVRAGDTVLAHLIMRGRQLVTVTRVSDVIPGVRLMMCYEHDGREYSFAVNAGDMVAVVTTGERT
jgi:hypothetical protein